MGPQSRRRGMMLTAHFIRILVETVRWQRRSSFKTANVHNALGNLRGYVGLVDGMVERDPCWRVTIPVMPGSVFSISALKPAALNHLIASYPTIIELLNPPSFHKYLQIIPVPFYSYSTKSSRRKERARQGEAEKYSRQSKTVDRTQNESCWWEHAPPPESTL